MSHAEQPEYRSFGREHGRSGRWLAPDVEIPKVGWSWINVDRDKDRTMKCWMCQCAHPVFLFEMAHPDYTVQVERDHMLVGRHCAGWMMGGEGLDETWAIEKWVSKKFIYWDRLVADAKRRRSLYIETETLSYQTKLALAQNERADCQWKQRTNGNWEVVTRPYYLLAFWKTGVWWFRIDNRGDKDYCSEKDNRAFYTVQDAAKAAALHKFPDPAKPDLSDLALDRKFLVPEKPLATLEAWNEYKRINPGIIAIAREQRLRADERARKRRKGPTPMSPIPGGV